MVEEALVLFLCGDVMLGRGIDQIHPVSVDPVLHEGYVKDARDYVALAERENGEIPRGVGPEYVWGDALAAMDRAKARVRIVNLETAFTTNSTQAPGKGIHYRAHPGNAAVLKAGGIDIAVLANNHILDWQRPGLLETLDSLRSVGVSSCGAGRSLAEATAPATVVLNDGAAAKVRVFSVALPSSGVPPDWAAQDDKAGVHFLPDLWQGSVEHLATLVGGRISAEDVVIVSVHWGDNWGYKIPDAQREFAHALIDHGSVDLIHGHSSHHPKGLEVYRDRLILYGCGDFINDYEGIGGHERYRPDLVLMVFPELDPSTGRLTRLRLAPMRMRRFRLENTTPADADWLARVLERESQPMGTRISVSSDGWLEARW